MIKAIVYESNTGFTKRYAELLSAETGLPCYPLADNKVIDGEPVIFMGWLSAGRIKGYDKAIKKFSVRAVAGVGMRPQDETALKELITQNKITDVPAFYLQGGLDMSKLRGMNKLLLTMFYKFIRSRAKKGDAEASALVPDFSKRVDYVSPDKLKDMLDWCKSAV